MKASFLIGNKEKKEFLYVANDRLLYGSNFSSDSVVFAHVTDGVGFLVDTTKVIAVIMIKITSGGISILNLESRLYLSSNPKKKDLIEGISFDRENAAEWEVFPAEIIKTYPTWLDFYFKLLESKSISLAFDIIEAEKKIEPPVLSYLITNLPKQALDYEISRRAPQAGFVQKLIDGLPKNYLITPLLMGLEPTSKKNKKTPTFIGTDRDIYGKVPNPANPWLIVNNSIRKKIKKTSKACIVATARNEGVYILEWLAYHLELGFDKIFLYTNNNQDNSLPLLRELHNQGVIELIESDVGNGGNAQVKAYTHSLLAMADVNRHEWCAFIDVDEFLTYDKSKFCSFPDYLDWAGGTGADVIALSWVLASNTTLSKEWTRSLVTERIKTCSPFQSNLIKCIVRPESAMTSGPHYPISTTGCELAAVNSERLRYISDREGQPTDITKSKSPTFKNAFLYHFELKSFPELIWKYSRNRGNYSATTFDISLNDQFLSRIGHFRKCIGTDSCPPIKLTVPQSRLTSKLAELLQLGQVSELYEAVITHTEERYTKLLNYLPEYLNTKPNKDNPWDRTARDWILSNFLSKLDS